MKYNFGLTNDKTIVDAAAAWRDAAIEDGWTPEPMYPKDEDISQSCRLTKDGFVAQILTRELNIQGGRYKYQAEVHAWGSDDLAIAVPFVYPGFDVLKALMKRSNYCGTENVDTQRVNFAGRCCETCLPEQRRLTEFPGWCD